MGFSGADFQKKNLEQPVSFTTRVPAMSDLSQSRLSSTISLLTRDIRRGRTNPVKKTTWLLNMHPVRRETTRLRLRTLFGRVS